MKIKGFLICIMILIFVGIASVNTVNAENEDGCICIHEERGPTKSEIIVLIDIGVRSGQDFEKNSEFWRNWEKRNRNTCIIQVQVLSEQTANGWNGRTEIYCCIYYHNVD